MIVLKVLGIFLAVVFALAILVLAFLGAIVLLRMCAKAKREVAAEWMERSNKG